MVKKAKLCYVYTGIVQTLYRRLILYINTDDIYKDIAEDVETRFDNSNYRLDRPLPKGKNKQVIGLYKDKSGKNIMIEFI